MKKKHLLLFSIGILAFICTPLFAQNCDNDTVPPVAVCDSEREIPLNSNQEVTIPAQLLNGGSSDDCSPVLEFRISLDTDGLTEPPPTTALTINEAGVYNMVLWVIDASGNWNNCWSEVTVLEFDNSCETDTIAPTLICINGLIVTLNPSLNTIELWAQDFISLVEDNCAITLSVTMEVGQTSTEPPGTPSVVFELPGTYAVTIWVTDDSGNSTFCETFVIIQEEPNTNKQISGFVFLDDNQNCQHDIEENFLGGWSVEVRPFINGLGDDSEPGTLLTTSSDPSGFYTIPIPTSHLLLFDSLEIRLSLAMNIDQICPLSYVLPTSIFTDEDEVFKDFAVSLLEDCHALQVDIAAPFLRRCFESNYTISYCNYGSDTAEDAFIEVTLDDYLTYLTSTLPHSGVDDNTYTFQLGNIAPGECGQLNLFVYVSCEAELGQTHCTEAVIFPNEPCGGNYFGAQLEAEGNCDSVVGEVKFTITNVGEEDMQEPKNYLVVEDVIMFMTADFELEVDSSVEIQLPANGSTYRLEVEQPDEYPWLHVTSVTVEGCGEGENGEVTLGVVTAFSQNEAGPFMAIDCQENIGSYDPNDKQAFPRGVGDEHLLRENTDIEYKIRFQNTGTDTAFTVVVLDTLSEWLDLSSVRPGASSHPYSFQILEDRVLEFRFTNILLPDSTTNEVASNGFVQFSVQQVPDNPHGTIIKNEAAIYFDYNEPVITNTVFHTIGELFVTVDTEEPSYENPNLKVYPNPFSGQTTFELPEATEGTFLIYNLQGQVIHQAPFTGKRLLLASDQLLSAGLYAYELHTRNGVVYRGKIVSF